MWDPYRIYQQRQMEMVQRCFVCNRYRQTSSVTNMMAGLDWEPLLNRRRPFRMFRFYKMHNGLVTIHPTLYLTPRQYHTSHKYHIPHSMIDQYAFSLFPSTTSLAQFLSEGCSCLLAYLLTCLLTCLLAYLLTCLLA